MELSNNITFPAPYIKLVPSNYNTTKSLPASVNTNEIAFLSFIRHRLFNGIDSLSTSSDGVKRKSPVWPCIFLFTMI